MEINSPTIALVDQDQEYILKLAECFERFAPGYTVKIFSEENELVIEVKENLDSPSLVIILLSPSSDYNPLSTLKEVKANELLRHVPIIQLVDDEELLEEAYAMGANSVIKRPITFVDIENVVQLICRFWLQIVRLPKTDR